jgi:hypothetical protein
MNRICQLPESLVYEPYYSYLERPNFKTFTGNVILFDEFVKIQSAFIAKNIGVMPLKGMALLFSVYKDISIRPMVDIDILIHEKDLEEAIGILSDLGYRRECGGPFNYYKQKKIIVFLDMQYNIWYIKALSRRNSEIYGIEQMWKGASRICLDNGSSALIMPPEDLLINVAAHAAIDHAQERSVWFNDIVNICDVHKEHFNCNVFIEKVNAYGLNIPIYKILESAKTISDKRILSVILEKLKPSEKYFLESVLYNSMLTKSSIPKIGHILRFLTISGLLRKLRLILFYFFPDRNFMILRYNIKNKNCIYFYYLRRIMSFFTQILKFSVLLSRKGGA